VRGHDKNPNIRSICRKLSKWSRDTFPTGAGV